MRRRGFFSYLLPGAGESSEIREDGRQDVVGPDQNDDPIRRYAQYRIEPLGDIDRQIATYAEVDKSEPAVLRSLCQLIDPHEGPFGGGGARAQASDGLWCGHGLILRLAYYAKRTKVTGHGARFGSSPEARQTK
jgi:hypothetical protein